MRTFVAISFCLLTLNTSRTAAEESSFVAGATLKIEAAQGAGGEGPAWHPELGVLSSGDGHIHQLDRKGTSRLFRQDAGK